MGDFLAMQALTSAQETGLLFPPEWIKAALVLALISIWVLIALFAYLNRLTRKTYFSMWTVGWMCFAVYLAALIGLSDAPDCLWLVMLARAGIGVHAVFMFYGTRELTGQQRSARELGGVVALIGLWSYAVTYLAGPTIAATLPVYLMLALASGDTSRLYFHQRHYRGARILGAGFLLWGVHLLAFPFLWFSPVLAAVTHCASAAIALLIAVGMVIEQEHTISESDYAELFNAAPDVMLLLDPREYRILELNSNAETLFNRPRADLFHRPFTDFINSAGGPPFPEGVLNRVAEIQVASADHIIVPCEASATLVTCPHGAVLQINLRDIRRRKRNEQALQDTNQRLERALTEIRATQQQLIQQERLQALAKMASGVAHDFNNSLAKILGFNELLLGWPEQLADTERTHKYLQMMNAAAQEATGVVNRLREFYRVRKHTDVYPRVNLNQIIDEAIAMSRPHWSTQMLARGAAIRIVSSLPALPPVTGHHEDLREVFVNLVFNAVDAMPQGGTIRIHARVEPDHLFIALTDTGVGMTEEVRQHCLEPFFTTKPERGAGLGLAIVYGILQRHLGSLDVESALGRGTTVTLVLPVATGQAADTPPPNRAPLRPLHVLVVEDEASLRDIEAEYLTSDGHRVVTATNGAEGLQRFREDQFDLVLTDRVMPEMNGDQLASEIKRLAPHIPVILITGYAEDTNRHAAPDGAINLTLLKPLTRALLRQGISQLMRN